MRYIIETNDGLFHMSKEEFELALCVYEYDFGWKFYTDDNSVWNPNEEEVHPIPNEELTTTYKYLTPWVEYPCENLKILKQKSKVLESLGVERITTYWDQESDYLATWGYDSDGFPIRIWWSPDYHEMSSLKEYSSR